MQLVEALGHPRDWRLNVLVAGTEVVFKRYVVGLISMLVAPLDDAPGVREQFVAMPTSYRMVPQGHPIYDAVEGVKPAAIPEPLAAAPAQNDSPPRMSAPPVVDKAAADLARAVSSLQKKALKNGWRDVDLADLAAPDAVSASAGLTLFDLARTSAPTGWDAASPYRYPWELADWRPPIQGWRPPKAPAKPAEPPPDEPVPTITSTIEPKPAPDPVKPGGDEQPPVDDKPPADDPAKGKKEVDPLDAYGTADQVAAARALLKTLTEEGGAPPTTSKARYQLKKHDLPSATAEQLVALLA
jgi:hypothetical protein